MSVSIPFLMVSAQLAFWQVPAVQAPPWQSVPAPHDLPLAHLVGHDPPQSMSASEPFFVTSEQVAAAHVPAAVQMPSAQSRGTEQGWPAGQGEQVPPQSTPVSP
ncbi:MAG: hypothetical protein ABUL77_00300 [Bacteroidota bacterium]